MGPRPGLPAGEAPGHRTQLFGEAVAETGSGKRGQVGEGGGTGSVVEPGAACENAPAIEV